MSKMLLQLFICGENPLHERAVGEIRSICNNLLGGCCQLDIIDISRSPELAERYKILATPALIRVWPAPAHRIVGDFSQTDRVLAELGVDHGLTSQSASPAESCPS
ncbi:MAG: circadian clock KaiB family protein [Planctomycetota bacterium]